MRCTAWSYLPDHLLISLQLSWILTSRAATINYPCAASTRGHYSRVLLFYPTESWATFISVCSAGIPHRSIFGSRHTTMKPSLIRRGILSTGIQVPSTPRIGSDFGLSDPPRVYSSFLLTLVPMLYSSCYRPSSHVFSPIQSFHIY